jgi:hypothetical protein
MKCMEYPGPNTFIGSGDMLNHFSVLLMRTDVWKFYYVLGRKLLVGRLFGATGRTRWRQLQVPRRQRLKMKAEARQDAAMLRSAWMVPLTLGRSTSGPTRAMKISHLVLRRCSAAS